MWRNHGSITLKSLSTSVVAALLVALAVGAISTAQETQSGLSEPVYRVASDTPAATAPTAPSTAIANNVVAQAGFDLTQQAGEHPLAPTIRTLQGVLANIDQNITDYACTFKKQERVDGELNDPQTMFMKVRNQPFSVYMFFLAPADTQGREVLFVAGENEGKMVVRETGLKRMMGKMNIDPNGALAMRGQKYPITNVGIRNLTAKVLAVAEADAKFQECKVDVNPAVKFGDRMATMVQVTHPQPRPNFHAHVWRIFLDNELKVPIHYDSFQWPDAPGQAPPPESSYTYANLKVNNGFAARDFSADNPDLFK
jgi:hypothetical protein